MTTANNAQGRASGRLPGAVSQAGAGFRAGTTMAVLALASSLLLSGCFGSSSDDDDEAPSDTTTSPDAFTATPQDISGGPVLDANNMPLDNATAGILSDQEITDFLQQLGLLDPADQEVFTFNFTTNSDGTVGMPLTAGDWVLGFNKDDIISAQRYRVLPENAATEGTFVTSHSCYDGQCQDIAELALVGSVSGLVHNDEGPVAGAQVGLSGGPVTNGTFAQTRTGSDGHYTLTFNVAGAKAHALQNSTLQVNADNHAPYRSELALLESSLAGVNVRLEPADNPQVLWRESFESDSPTVAQWQVDGGLGDTAWQRIEAGHGITNAQAGGAVNLAPDDTSEGRLPDPADGISAFWYGNAGQGNPGGDPDSAGAHSGSLTSPAIDLSGVDSDTPISLHFNTWWETPSGNEAMDQERMTVLVSTDGETFTPLAGLTPRSQPQSGEDFPRHSIPFSNQGFNRAPAWTTQEPIALDALAGESQVQVRFDYQAPEGSGEHFRGWLIDEVAVVQQPGTFPAWQAHEEETGNGNGNGNGEDIADGDSAIDWNDWELDEWDWNNWDMDQLCDEQPLYCALISLDDF